MKPHAERDQRTRMLCETIRLIMQRLVDNIEMLNIRPVASDGMDTIICVSVASNDLGKALGKNGRMVKALRQIVKSFREQHGGGYRISIEKSAVDDSDRVARQEAPEPLV